LAVPVGGGLTLDGLIDPLTSNAGPNGDTWEGHGILDAGGGGVNVSVSGGGTEALLLNQVHDDDQVRSAGCSGLDWRFCARSLTS